MKSLEKHAWWITLLLVVAIFVYGNYGNAKAKLTTKTNNGNGTDTV